MLGESFPTLVTETCTIFTQGVPKGYMNLRSALHDAISTLSSGDAAKMMTSLDDAAGRFRRIDADEWHENGGLAGQVNGVNYAKLLVELALEPRVNVGIESGLIDSEREILSFLDVLVKGGEHFDFKIVLALMSLMMYRAWKDFPVEAGGNESDGKNKVPFLYQKRSTAISMWLFWAKDCIEGAAAGPEMRRAMVNLYDKEVEK